MLWRGAWQWHAAKEFEEPSYLIAYRAVMKAMNARSELEPYLLGR
jgi:hypothetical protein